MKRTLFLALIWLIATGCGGTPVTATATPGPTTNVTPTPKQPTPVPTPAATRASATPSQPPTAPPTAAPTPSPTAATTSGPPIVIDGDVVTINPSALAPLFYAPPESGSPDPFYFIHTIPAVDGFFLSIEAYTVYGPTWTGQLGTFDIDCSAGGTGICVHFDPDGPGPLPDYGSDFSTTGQITFTVLETGAFEVTLVDVAFAQGTVIPGPFTLASD